MRIRSLVLPAVLAVSLVAPLAPASAAPSNLTTAKNVAAELNAFLAKNPNAEIAQFRTYVRSTSSTQAAKEAFGNQGDAEIIGWEVGTPSSRIACVVLPVLSDRFTAVSGTCQAWWGANLVKIWKKIALTTADKLMQAAFRDAQAVAAFAGGKATIALVLDGLTRQDTSQFRVTSTKSTITLQHPWASATYRISGGKIRR